MKPIWAQLKADLTPSGVKFIEKDETTIRSGYVEAYPTIIMIDEYGHAHRYESGPDYITLRNFIVRPAL
jgi:hypothetical protein